MVRLRLKRAMELFAASVPLPLTRRTERELRVAAQRCLACPRHALCDQLCLEGALEELALYCPNTPYIARLRNKP